MMGRPKSITLCPARGLEHNGEDANEFHILVSEEKQKQ